MRLSIFLLTGLLLMTPGKALSGQAGATRDDNNMNQAAELGKTVKLPNGLTILVKKDDRFPLVSMRLYVHAGSAYEVPSEEGISHVLEHMVFKGTESFSKNGIAGEVEKTGGYLNAATSFDYTVYLTDMTSEHWRTGLNVLKEMAFLPTLDPDELESEKKVIVAELKRGEDSPGQRLFRMAQQAALTDTPYYNPIIGYEKSIMSFSSEGIRNYIAKHYQPQSMLLVVCGNVVPDEVLQEANKLFGSLQNSQIVTPPLKQNLFQKASGFKAVVEQGPWKKVHLGLVLPGPALGDLKASQLDVLAQLLGGDASSRFYRTYKYEKRLVDSISVSNYNFERLGMLYITATLDAEKLPAFWEAFSKELAALPTVSFTKEELERAKLNLEDDMYRSKETLSGYASKLGYFAFFAEGEQSEMNYLQAVRDTDQTTLSALIKDYFKPEKLTLAALLPEGASPAKATGKNNAKDPVDDSVWFSNLLNSNWKSTAKGQADKSRESNTGLQEVIDLGQGRTLVLMPDNTLPYTAVNMMFNGGDSLIDEKDQGLAAFTASLLTKGTKKLSATALEDFLSDRAASFSATPGRQSFAISMNAPARFIPDLFELLQQTLVTPAMKEEEASRVKENQITAITMSEDQPMGLAFRRMFPFLLQGHTYGYLQLGEKKRVAEFTAKDARNFWREQTLEPWVLSVCGTFDKDVILAAVKKLPVPAKAAKDISMPQWNTTKTLDLNLPGRNQAHLLMVFPTAEIGSPDEAALELLQNILAGQSGLLFRDLRDKQGLGYSVTAIPWKTEKTGALIFYIGTEPEKVALADNGFRTVIAALHSEPLSDEELQRGKNQMQGDYYRDHQSLASRSSEAAVLSILKQPLDSARKLIDKANEVTPEQLQEVARKYLKPESAYIITVKP